MKFFVLTTFILLLGVSYALPFQAPVAGDYQCFSSEESIFDANAQDIGASLTIAADNSYTFTTSNASENGSVTTSEDTSADLDNFFQSGSVLKLQPSSGTTPYDGMFVSDKQGGMYVFIQNNNGLNIRCQSAGADIANAIKQIATEQAATEAPTQTNQEAQSNQETQAANTPETPGTPDPLAQGDDPYLVALSTVYATGKMAVLTKEWCDVKVPASQTLHAQAFETWQAEQFFFAIEEKMKVLLGTGFLPLEEKFGAKRDEVFASFDSSLGDPTSACQNLLTTLTENYNLRQQFPNEYATIEAGTSETNSLSPETTSIPSFGEVIAGGPLEPGDYTCISEYYWSYDNTTNVREYVLSLYPDMGLRTSEADESYEAVFEYNQGTGELFSEGDYDFWGAGYEDIIKNYFYEAYDGDNHITSFKFYRDAQNQPVLYGQNDEYTSSDDNIVTTLCRYKGVAQRPSPAEEVAALVEAERFKYVTAPGQGLQIADIEGIIHTGENVYEVTGLKFKEATYLLLKDGTIYKNLQVPPNDLNVVDSKQYEQENWGQWQRNGEAISVQWFGSNEGLVLDGAFVLPAGSGERLDVSYNNLTGSTIGGIGFGGVVSTHSDTLTFMPDGHFERSRYSTMGSTSIGPDSSYSSNYYSDEEGTVGGTSTSNTVGDVTSGVTVTSESTNPNPPATTGTYTLDGYTLELRYDDGRVERTFFYFWGSDKDHVVIGGVTYSLE